MTDMKFLRFEWVEISQEQDMTGAFDREGPVMQGMLLSWYWYTWLIFWAGCMKGIIGIYVL